MKHDLEIIVKTIKERGLTAYKIAEETGLTEVGINKILNGKSKTPRQTTLEILHNYLFISNENLHNYYVNEEKLHSEFSTTIFTVDKVAKGNYFAFDIKNNSMNGGGIYDTPNGAEVLCREIGRHLWLSLHKNDYGFILMTKKAIYHKDIKSYNPQNGMFTLSSRDKDNQDFEININDVFRIFNVIKRTF